MTFLGRPVLFGGTSSAAALVTGSLAAFTLITNYALTITEAIRLLHKTAMPFPNLPSFDDWASPGILNAYRIGAVAERLNQMCGKENSSYCMERLLPLDETYQFERESELLLRQAISALERESSCTYTTKMRMAALLDPYNSKAWEHLASSVENGEFYLAMKIRAQRNSDEVILDQMCEQKSGEHWQHLRYFSAPYLKALIEREDCSPGVQTAALNSLLYNTERADFQQFLVEVIEHPLTDRQVLVEVVRAIVWNYHRITDSQTLASRIINHSQADESLQARVSTWIQFGP